MLGERLEYTIKAEDNLRDYPEASQLEKEEWLKDIRMGPPLLFKILEQLQEGGEPRVEGQRKLVSLFDVRSNQQTMRVDSITSQQQNSHPPDI